MFYLILAHVVNEDDEENEEGPRGQSIPCHNQ
jgi:hypothetical protein